MLRILLEGILVSKWEHIDKEFLNFIRLQDVGLEGMLYPIYLLKEKIFAAVSPICIYSLI